MTTTRQAVANSGAGDSTTKRNITLASRKDDSSPRDGSRAKRTVITADHEPTKDGAKSDMSENGHSKSEAKKGAKCRVCQ